MLKPKHSAFYATPLDLLLRHLRVTRLLISGVASDQCIVMSAAEAQDARLRVIVPGDCVAALTPARNARALRHLEEVHGIRTTAVGAAAAAGASRRADAPAQVAQSRPSEPYSDSANCQASSREANSCSPRLFAGRSPRASPPLSSTPAFQPESPQGSTIGVAR